MSASHDGRPAVGLVGLGNMGSAFAERLLDAGYDVVVYNRSPEKAVALADRGAAVAGSVAELATRAEIVLTSLPDDAALESVAAELTAAASAGTLLVDTSTVSPQASARVATLADEASVEYLRAPVSGNPVVVRAGNVAFIVSGPPAAVERADRVLRAIGRSVHVVGGAEEARIVKLSTNLMIAGLAQLMAEALVLGEASGVSRSALLETIGDSAAGAPFVEYKTEPLLRDDYSATFTTALMEKDLDLVLDAAEASGVQLPLAGELKALIRATVEAGYGDDDFMALFLRLRSASDQEVLG